ncbi:anaerobic glycerol-3-phosphate dehydrogenase subunit B [Variovorax sp. PBS-H4]|uniref:FAD-dependent oxidoreductase n=1 Tax=Variovorax sp. PBS-H4 TaxID=434008 RepID=UPI00131611D7|nr:FAD-dependent oxidoreductase [Variovorax sp. PBS-H4]VTU25043.1 anaerobic glycerol-3-phosphate dehydrogenase subunit B [Variovorax sp. PBS-H4]
MTAARHIEEPARRTPLVEDYAVIVAGGGTAGAIAAIAAARNGARTLLVERGGFLGGHIASQLLEHSAGWFDARGERIVAGLPQELVDRLVAAGASPGHVRDDTGYTLSRVPVNHELFKSVVTAMCHEAGVDLLMFSPVVQALREGDCLHGVIVENKSGRTAYAARAVVDCTGDADVAERAGCSFLSQQTGAADAQPVSLLFKLGGIDHAALLDHVAAHPDQFKLGVPVSALRGEDHVNLWGFGPELARAREDGVVSLARNELHYSGWVRTGEAVINVTRCAVDATRADEMGRAEVVLRRQMQEFAEFFRRYIPGAQNSFLSASASCVGVRESRRVEGRAVLTDDDVRRGRRFADGVLRGGFPIDSHDPKGASLDSAEHVDSGYDIPLGAMLPRGVDGLLVAGRCISAERKALASARITATCMAMGQAAGTAAALAAREGVAPGAIDIGLLQRTLRAQGAILGGAA